MSLFESIFLGSLQGFTEFLPVSSSGHLWIAQYFMGMEEPSLMIEIALHFATLLAVIVYFWKDIYSLFINFIFPSKTEEEKSEKLLAWKLLLATGITGIIGIATKDFFESSITLEIVSITLFITAGLILVSEYFSPQKQSEFTWFLAGLLGIIQAVALFPGISRSGITIAFLLLVGIAKTQSVRISFLLSIPTILGASLLLLNDFSETNVDYIPLLIAGGFAFIIAYITIWGMMKYLDKIWKWCAVWCIILGISIFLF